MLPFILSSSCSVSTPPPWSPAVHLLGQLLHIAEDLAGGFACRADEWHNLPEEEETVAAARPVFTMACEARRRRWTARPASPRSTCPSPCCNSTRVLRRPVRRPAAERRHMSCCLGAILVPSARATGDDASRYGLGRYCRGTLAANGNSAFFLTKSQLALVDRPLSYCSTHFTAPPPRPASTTRRRLSTALPNDHVASSRSTLTARPPPYALQKSGACAPRPRPAPPPPH